VTPLLALVLAAAPAAISGSPGALDDDRAAWHYRRSLRLEGEAPLAVLSLPPEVLTRGQADLKDLRIVAADGREVPYVLDRAVARESHPRWAGRLVDTRREAKTLSSWIVDFGEARLFDRLELDVPEQDFAKRLRIEAALDRQSWIAVAQDVGVFDWPWTVRVHHTLVELPQRVSARYLRITADDRTSRPIEVKGAVAVATRRLAGESWRRAAKLRPLGKSGGVSRYALDLPAGFPLESLELDADDAVFSRPVVLREERAANSRREEVVLGERQIYRLRLEDASLAGSLLELPARRPERGELVLEVKDGDSPPLANLRAVASAAATRLLFPAGAGAAALYYGNQATRAPLYDIERLKACLALESRFVEVALGEELENPRFRRSPPLAFAPARGAALEVARWRSVRRVTIGDGEDLYSLTLAAEDVGQLRPDLGDLRIVDDGDRQVPYVVEPAVAEATVGLAIEKASSSRPSVSRYRFSLGTRTDARGTGLPLTSLELRFAEGFFSRPVRLLAPPTEASRGREHLLFAGPLARSPIRVSAFAVEPAGEPSAEFLPIALDGRRIRELALEVDEGDNAPLTLLDARGVVQVPRVAFKGGAGTFRVLMGNPDASAPHYDIAALRQDVLAYSALPVDALAAEANPAFRRLATDFLQQTPPTVLLWAALLLSVVALLLLTARIVRSTPQ
jgi:Protein of unknown function (DUF3999)/F5/8 type C domain